MFSGAEVVHVGVVAQLSIWGAFRRGAKVDLMLLDGSPSRGVTSFSEPNAIINCYREFDFQIGILVFTTGHKRLKGDPRTADQVVEYLIQISSSEVAKETLEMMFTDRPYGGSRCDSIAVIDVFALATHVEKQLGTKLIGPQDAKE